MNDLAVNREISPEQLAVIRETICKDATPEEMDLYLFDCSRNGVHPLDRLIHFTKRKSKNKDGSWGARYTPITSIDFFRMRAEASGEYGGQDDAVFTGDHGKPGFKASVTVFRFLNGQRVPITASARWDEYNPDSEFSLWRKMPYLMLAKCAEALALRKAFPKQLHGLYSTEEMAQAENKTGLNTPPKLQSGPTTPYLKSLVNDADAAPPPDAVLAEQPTAAVPEQQEMPEPDSLNHGEIHLLVQCLRKDGLGKAELRGIRTNYGMIAEGDDYPEAFDVQAEYLRELREAVTRATARTKKVKA